MARVLVIGASRGIGMEVSKALAGDGHFVRAMSRSGRAEFSQSGVIEPFAGDALDPGDLETALDDVDTVVQALGVKADAQMITGPVTLFSSATRALVPAMEKAGVKRLIAVTGFGAGDSSSSVSLLQSIPFRVALGRAYDDKSIQEELIVRSRLDWMLVRPGVLTDGPPSGRYKALWQRAEWQNGLVSRADVADFIAKHVADERLGGRKAVIIRWPFCL